MCQQMTLEGTSVCTCSQASAAGPLPSSGQAGKAPPGPAAVPVSRFRARASAKAMPTNDISGPLFSSLSPSVCLQSSLASRLQARMDVSGSPEYVLTWRELDMPAGLPIWRLRALARRTSDNAYGGWPTPTATTRDTNLAQATARLRRTSGPSRGGVTLPDIVRMAGWPTPTPQPGTGGKDATATGKRPDGSKANVSLQAVARLAGWQTSRARGDAGPRKDGTVRNLEDQVRLAGWPTGVTQSGSPAVTAGRGVLSPEHSRWLMGYPSAWASCAPTATP